MISNEVDLRGLWKELDGFEKELEEESKSLREVWLKIADLKEKLDSEESNQLRQPEFSFLSPEEIVIFNVGGQIFEATVQVLTRDPCSILAACCRQDPPLERNSDGLFYFDRDWWIFRHILSFLRSNILPTEVEILKELYAESSFYRLESLKKSIEELPMSHVHTLYRTQQR